MFSLETKPQWGWIFLVDCTLTLPAPPGSGTHHPHSELCPQTGKACKHREHSHSQRAASKMLHHYTHGIVLGRRMEGWKLVPSVRLSLFALSLQQQNTRICSTEGPHQSQTTLLKHIKPCCWQIRSPGFHNKLPQQFRKYDSTPSDGWTNVALIPSGLALTFQANVEPRQI